jgi:hypothetical protein
MPTPSYARYFQELAGQDPEAVCKRALCDYDHSRGCFRLTLWGQDYEVFPDESRIARVGKTALDPENYHFLFIICYLLNAKDLQVKNQWISEKDIPGGPTFFRGPHEVPTRLIVNRYGNDLLGFKKGCERLKGVSIDLGDGAFSFHITPRIPVAVVYWIGDEDFPAEAKVLFDKTIIDHLALDIIFALAVLVCNRIANA